MLHNDDLQDDFDDDQTGADSEMAPHLRQNGLTVGAGMESAHRYISEVILSKAQQVMSILPFQSKCRINRCHWMKHPS